MIESFPFGKIPQLVEIEDGGGIDAQDLAEIENEAAAHIGAARRHDLLDLKQQPMGAAEEHKSVQPHDRDAAAVLREHLLMGGRAIDAAAIGATIDDLPHQPDAAGIDGKRHARADDADRHARQEVPLDDDQHDDDDLEIFGDRHGPARPDQPLVQHERALLHEEAAQHRHRKIDQHVGAEPKHRETKHPGNNARGAAAAAGPKVEQRAADRERADHAAAEPDQDIGEPVQAQFVVEVDVQPAFDLDHHQAEKQRDRGHGE